MVYWLKNVLFSETNYIKEKQIIKEISASNGFETTLIATLIAKHKNKNNKHAITVSIKQ